MDWLEASVTTNTPGADIVSEALMRYGAKGTQIIDRADVPDPAKPTGHWELVDPKLMEDMPEHVVVKAWFPEGTRLAALQEELATLPALSGLEMGELKLSFSQVKEEDWAEYWKNFYKPFRLGTRLVVRPTWESYTAQPGDLVIDLDPGMAFGTGTHETTALCAVLIEAYCRQGQVLDIGTGSGILAIAAAKLGAQRVLALDIDPVAVKVARENVAQNGLTDRVRVEQGDPLSGVAGQYDMAVANILADVIISLAGPVKQHVKPEGVFICSGIIRERAEDVRAALEGAGHTIVDERYEGAWAAFASRPVQADA